MATAADFGYAQARMQARHAQRLSELQWNALAPVAAYGDFLAAARATELRRHLRSISPHSDVHDIESLLRREFLESVAEVARWVPRAWRRAVDWIAALVHLPLARGIGLGAAEAPWMQREWAHWQARFSPLAPSAAAQQDLAEAWIAAWRATWPRNARARASLERLLSLVRRHQRELAALRGAGELPGREAWERRRAFAAQMQREFRAGLLAPAAVFAHLAMEALDLERLRAELVRRRLFAARRA
jgi:hypothetical protein